jgi:hypothetical protein
MKIMVLWDVMLCILVEITDVLEEPTASSCMVPVTHHIPEDDSLV